MSPSHDNVAHPGHQGRGLVPGLLVQLVTLEPLGALGDGGPVYVDLATASAKDGEIQNRVSKCFLLRRDRHLSAARGGS